MLRGIEVMWTVIQRDAEGKPRLTSMGRHVDPLVREEGTWKIAQRRGLIDLPQRLEPPVEKPAKG